MLRKKEMKACINGNENQSLMRHYQREMKSKQNKVQYVTRSIVHCNTNIDSKATPGTNYPILCILVKKNLGAIHS
jgi:hypothetical protein